MADDLRRDLANVLKADDRLLGLGVAQLFWCPDMLAKAIVIADSPEKIQTVNVGDGRLVYYTVKGSKKDEEYQVVPNKFCSCYFYLEQVLKRRTAWTCKHEIAVQLKLATAHL